MAVKIVLKHSSTEDKRPTPGQLENGEIALNYNEAGPFLTCKDSEGNIQQVGGVKISEFAPDNPVMQTLWFQPSSLKLFVYDGNSFLPVAGSGGGGGGGGDIIQVIGNDGIDASEIAGVVTLEVDLAGGDDGLEFDAGRLKASVATDSALGSVKIGRGIDVTSDGTISVDTDEAGLQPDEIIGGTAIRVDAGSDRVTVNADIATTGALGVVQIGEALEVAVDGVITPRIASEVDTGIVKIGEGINVQADGTISVSVPMVLKFKGSVDLRAEFTGQTDLPLEAGDSYVNDNFTPVVAAGWIGIVGSQSTAGDLVIWDGAEWKLIATGGMLSMVDGGDGIAVNQAGGIATVTVRIGDGIVFNANGEIEADVRSVNGQIGDVLITPANIGALAPGDDISELNNDVGFITAGDLPAPPSVPVTSVNTKTGDVVLDANDVGALQTGDNVSELNNDAGYITSANIPGSPVVSVNSKTGVVVLDANDVGALQSGDVISELDNDAGYITAADVPPAPAVGEGTITITQPGAGSQTFNVNQASNKEIVLKNDNTQVTPGNGALTIKTAGQGANASGTFTANQSTGSTLTLPTIRYGDLSGRPSIPAAAGNGTITITQPGTSAQTFTVNQTGNTTIALKNDNTVTTPGNGTITIVQPGVSNQSFTTNQGGNQTITLKNDNTVVTPGNGALTIKTAGEAKAASGTFTANQGSASTIVLPQIRYSDLSGTPTIPAAAGNGTITIVQPGTSNQTFTVNQSGNKTITLKNDNTQRTYTGGVGINISGTEITTDTSIPRNNINNSFSGRQTFIKVSVTDNLRMQDGASFQLFDNTPSDIGGTTSFNYARIDISGGVETTSGSAVNCFQNGQVIDMNGGTNTLNIFPCGIKSTPIITKSSFGNYAHILLQSLTFTNGGSLSRAYGFRVNAEALPGTDLNYGLTVVLPENGNKNFAVHCGGTAPSFFGGNVTSAGTIGFSGRFSVRMEADDPAAYETTYETELDDELNEIQVAKEEYIGATEDLATMVTSVRSRLTAIESVKIAETESQSSELFNLLADLTSRIEALESASGGASVATATTKKK